MAKLLLVEDDNQIRRMLSLRLQMRDHTVEIAENGKIGVEKAQSGDYDAVLMDMHMPVMDGHEAARSLRQSHYEGLIIAVTASVMIEETEQALTAGCNQFIAKPIGDDFEDLIEQYIKEFTANINGENLPSKG